MKTLKKISILILFLVAGLQANRMKAQTQNTVLAGNSNYNNAIGLRVGETSGLSIKHFMNGSSHAIEGIIGITPYSVGITALYEQYVSTDVKGLSWYYGAGGHVNTGINRRVYYTYYNDNRYYVYRYNYPGVGVGIDGIVGVEYKIAKVPFAISFDLKPFVEINNSPNIFLALDPGLGLKFTF
ncbi:MAG TPA: hypothetical protein VNZ49_04035 [Bacteroidia bacterium]|jgi:hypothetical protein|nr:hypothetical protein [Bacteroidia bacterium]